MASENRRRPDDEYLSHLRHDACNRRRTYYDFPNSSELVRLLSESGFYYSGIGEMVCCAFCHVKVTNISSSTNLAYVHRPDCSMNPRYIDELVDKVEPLQLNDTSKDCVEDYFAMRQRDTAPRTECYVCRLATFQTWPRHLKQKPTDLANSGFYYLGPTDHVKCFDCGVVLCNWEPTDVPRLEHIKHKPHCPTALKDNALVYCVLS